MFTKYFDIPFSSILFIMNPQLTELNAFLTSNVISVVYFSFFIHSIYKYNGLYAVEGVPDLFFSWGLIQFWQFFTA